MIMFFIICSLSPFFSTVISIMLIDQQIEKKNYCKGSFVYACFVYRQGKLISHSFLSLSFSCTVIPIILTDQQVEEKETNAMVILCLFVCAFGGGGCWVRMRTLNPNQLHLGLLSYFEFYKVMSSSQQITMIKIIVFVFFNFMSSCCLPSR